MSNKHEFFSVSDGANKYWPKFCNAIQRMFAGRILFGVATLVFAASLVSCTCSKQVAKKDSKMMVIETKYGQIEVEFFADDAPQTVARIQQLVTEGFYNGLSFHRVVPGFVVQGGDPRGDGTGGSGKKLQAEFNARQHVEGSVAMARASDPNSADSQFYISLGRHPHLDKNYTVFGQVVKGMDAVKQVRQGDVMTKVTLK